ncbi:radical SAM protein [Candidatus Magnetomonas plexicatena]|uniref:radical SAM protein n=1 Tax=Candidatus Magnetomonas plexicatena TaxID=2552947 RepID=UPI001C76EF75|nr:radical SAM protein [Nitrospirales bacterium LBB_01]
MRKTYEIRIALAMPLSNEPTAEDIVKIHDLYAAMSHFFSYECRCFWHFDTDPIKCRQEIMKAELIEDFNYGMDYLFWAPDLNSINVPLMWEMIKRIDAEPLTGLYTVSKDTGKLSVLAVCNEIIVRFNRKYGLNGWFRTENNNGDDNPDAAFLENLTALGDTILPHEKKTQVTTHVPALRIPAVVNYLPKFHPRAHPLYKQHNLTTFILSILELASASKNKKNIALYGAGTVSNALAPLLGDSLKLVVDRNDDLCGKPFYGTTVVKPESLKDSINDFDTIVITPIAREMEIRKYLKEILGASYDTKTVIGFDGLVTHSSDVKLTGSTIISKETHYETGNLQIKPSDKLITTNERKLTKRAVLYVGYLCNIKCIFCYYAHTPAKNWHTLEECKADAYLYRTEYKNEWVDITGGEPTIYPHILDLVKYCNDIGLKPSLISNMRALANVETLLKLKDAGVYDFLCSVHAIGETYDFLTKSKDGWKHVISAVENFQKYDIKWRVNCTMTAVNKTQLKDIATFSYQHGGRVINFISYNPFEGWTLKMDIDFQARHTDISPYLREALDYCDEVGLEANVRYLPFCMMRGHENKCYNYPQLSYDHHEWDFCSWFSDKTRNPSPKTSDGIRCLIDKEEDLHILEAHKFRRTAFEQCDKCRFCALGFICDGIANQYAGRFGTDEVIPYDGDFIKDPTFFIRTQKKIVDE